MTGADKFSAIKISAECEDFIVANKPFGVAVHGNGHSLIDRLTDQLGLTRRLDPVHRLDKDTSGIIILSKTHKATAELSAQFSLKKVNKIYIAVATRKPRKTQGKIVGDMVKSRNGNFKLMHSSNNPARTDFISKSFAPNRRLFFLKPITGKTHQLRVALKSISSPILGDTRYGGEQSDRMYLHAYHLEFEYRGRPVKVTAESPVGLEWPALAFVEQHMPSIWRG